MEIKHHPPELMPRGRLLLSLPRNVILGLFLAMGSFILCSCDSKEELTGDIVRRYSTGKCDFLIHDETGKLIDNQVFVAHDQEGFEAFFPYIIGGLPADSCNYQEIDFSEHALIWVAVKMEGSEKLISYDFQILTEEKRTILTATCLEADNPGSYTWNVVTFLVKAFPPDFQVELDIEPCSFL